jgi:AbrB family looped-hinge helix DNA binding protein
MRLIRTLSDKGQILIPKYIRDIMVLKGGPEVELNVENSIILIEIKMNREI